MISGQMYYYMALIYKVLQVTAGMFINDKGNAFFCIVLE